MSREGLHPTELDVTIFCPKEEKRVPIWYCLGSYMQRREPCPDLIELTLSKGQVSDHKCKIRRATRNEHRTKL